MPEDLFGCPSNSRWTNGGAPVALLGRGGTLKVKDACSSAAGSAWRGGTLDRRCQASPTSTCAPPGRPGQPSWSGDFWALWPAQVWSLKVPKNRQKSSSGAALELSCARCGHPVCPISNQLLMSCYQPRARSSGARTTRERRQMCVENSNARLVPE